MTAPIPPIPPRLLSTYPEPNPMQAEVLAQWSPGQGSAIISAPTGSGKTLFADMMLEHHGVDRCRTILYAAPFKALAQERLRDWRRMFPDLKVEICTGDQTLTEKDAARLEAADAIILTFESLSLRCTQFRAEERNAWLENCALVCDEVHLLGDRERGHVLEVLLMSFRAVAPQAEILGLSATLGEPERIAEWLGARLILSDKRAVPLNISFHPERGGGQSGRRGGDWLSSREATVLALLRAHRGDKAIVFSPTRAETARLAQLLSDEGFAARKHNAALDLDERLETEAEFREGNLEVICATSTLSAGINAPARRVIIAGIRRGKTLYTAIELNQMAGRAGRPRYDNEGNAHIVCLATDLPDIRAHMADIRTDSVLGETTPTGRRNLQFHLNNAIYRKAITTREEAEDWYRRSLAWLQRPELPDVDGALDKLVALGVVEPVDGRLAMTGLGRVAACLHPDTLITTSCGPKRIADLKEGDRVMSHRGRFCRVLGVSTRNYTGPLLRVKASHMMPVLMTPEHRVLSNARTMLHLRNPKGRYTRWRRRRAKWKTASTLVPADSGHPGVEVQVPIERDRSREFTVPIQVDLYRRTTGGGRCRVSNQHSLPKSVRLDEELAEFFGLYVAEGSTCTNGRVSFAINKREKNLTRLIRSVAASRLRLPSHIDDVPDTYCRRVNINSVVLARRFDSMFGHGAKNKHFPEEWLAAPPKIIAALVRGAWAGDGRLAPKHNEVANYSTISPRLAEQMCRMLRRLGYLAKVRTRLPPPLSPTGTTSLCYLLDMTGKQGTDFAKSVMQYGRFKPRCKTYNKVARVGMRFHAPVRKIETVPYTGPVFNLHVKGDKSYMCSFAFAVHNSLALYPDDVSTWRSSFSEVAENYLWGSDIAVAAALVHPSQLYASNYVTREEEGEITAWCAKWPEANDLLMRRGIQFCKAAYVNFLCFTDPGQDWRVRQVRADMDRWMAAIGWVMSMTGFEMKEELKRTGIRMRYAIPPDGVKLVGLVGVGHARAMRLLGAGIKEYGDILDREAEVKKLLGERVGERIVAQARRKAHAMVLGKLTKEEETG